MDFNPLQPLQVNDFVYLVDLYYTGQPSYAPSRVRPVRVIRVSPKRAFLEYKNTQIDRVPTVQMYGYPAYRTYGVKGRYGVWIICPMTSELRDYV